MLALRNKRPSEALIFPYAWIRPQGPGELHWKAVGRTSRLLLFCRYRSAGSSLLLLSVSGAGCAWDSVGRDVIQVCEISEQMRGEYSFNERQKNWGQTGCFRLEQTELAQGSISQVLPRSSVPDQESVMLGLASSNEMSRYPPFEKWIITSSVPAILTVRM